MLLHQELQLKSYAEISSHSRQNNFYLRNMIYTSVKIQDKKKSHEKKIGSFHIYNELVEKERYEEKYLIHSCLKSM